MPLRVPSHFINLTDFITPHPHPPTHPPVGILEHRSPRTETAKVRERGAAEIGSLPPSQILLLISCFHSSHHSSLCPPSASKRRCSLTDFLPVCDLPAPAAPFPGSRQEAAGSSGVAESSTRLLEPISPVCKRWILMADTFSRPPSCLSFCS